MIPSIKISQLNTPISRSQLLAEDKFFNHFQADVCVLLLQYGASPYAENSDSKTPIELARGDAKAVFTGKFCSYFLCIE